jgi:RNA polymerase II subunit A small phosphatase-like protein
MVAMLMPVDAPQLVGSHPQQPISSRKQANGDLAEVSDADAAVDVDVSSVITQVTGPVPLAVQNKLRLEDQQLQQGNGKNGSWKSRVQKLLCCFTPSPVPHYKQDLQLVNSLYQQVLPPQPPRVYREAVIGAKRPEDLHKKTLVLDLDETLVHSSFKPIPNPDYIIPVEIDGRLVDVYVLKRPWLDHFMNTIGPRFEVVVFTASLAKYADPLLDLMDKAGLVRWRLFRESCCPYEGNYVKDLNCLGRDLSSTIIVDNSPHSYIFQPANAVPIGTFIDDMEDQELLELLPQLLQVESVDDVRRYLGQQLQSSLCAR